MRFLIALLLLAAAPALAEMPMRLTSPDFADGGELPNSAVYQGFGCHGQNRSPELRWTNPPPQTKSLAVTVYDPDAPTGSGWWHWVIYDLPPGTRRLEPGMTSPPSGAKVARNDFGNAGYGGACPPVGDNPHHYVFTVTALSVPTLGLPQDASPAMVGFALHQRGIASAQLTATYGQ